MTKDEIISNIDKVLDSKLITMYKTLSKEEFAKYIESDLFFNVNELEYQVELYNIKTALISNKIGFNHKLSVYVTELIGELKSMQDNWRKDLNEHKKWI